METFLGGRGKDGVPYPGCPSLAMEEGWTHGPFTDVQPSWSWKEPAGWVGLSRSVVQWLVFTAQFPC